VRQPWEYEEDHLPGAKLVPLGDLKDSFEELDRDKPTLVYCAVGGGRVAAQLMSGLGFPEVYNLAGGIKAYRGAKAEGPYELNLDLVRGDESPGDMLKLAFGMEKALGAFYQAMVEKSQDQELVSLLTKLRHIEAAHKRKVFERYQAINPHIADLAALEAQVAGDVKEGGYRVAEFLAKNEPHLKTAP